MAANVAESILTGDTGTRGTELSRGNQCRARDGLIVADELLDPAGWSASI